MRYGGKRKREDRGSSFFPSSFGFSLAGLRASSLAGQQANKPAAKNEVRMQIWNLSCSAQMLASTLAPMRNGTARLSYPRMERGGSLERRKEEEARARSSVLLSKKSVVSECGAKRERKKKGDRDQDRRERIYSRRDASSCTKSTPSV